MIGLPELGSQVVMPGLGMLAAMAAERYIHIYQASAFVTTQRDLAPARVHVRQFHLRASGRFAELGRIRIESWIRRP